MPRDDRTQQPADGPDGEHIAVRRGGGAGLPDQLGKQDGARRHDQQQLRHGHQQDRPDPGSLPDGPEPLTDLLVDASAGTGGPRRLGDPEQHHQAEGERGRVDEERPAWPDGHDDESREARPDDAREVERAAGQGIAGTELLGRQDAGQQRPERRSEERLARADQEDQRCKHLDAGVAAHDQGQSESSEQPGQVGPYQDPDARQAVRPDPAEQGEQHQAGKPCGQHQAQVAEAASGVQDLHRHRDGEQLVTDGADRLADEQQAEVPVAQRSPHPISLGHARSGVRGCGPRGACCPAG